MTDFTPITNFSRQFGVGFNEAFRWNQANVLAFLRNVSANPGAYGAPQIRQEAFRQLSDDIHLLISPNGAKFRAPNPPQHLLRTATAVAPIGPFAWTNGNDRAQMFFILFDLLGIFLSLMGVPTTTQQLTATTYALPLVALYGKWCRQLAQSQKFAPRVAQITWARGLDGRIHPFLGASVAGFPKGETWKNNARMARWAYLRGILEAPYHQFGYSRERGPVGTPPEKLKQAGTNFGNCGETYPFLYVVADPNYASSSHGIALEVANAVEQTDYNGQALWKLGPLKPPCENCSQLLTWYGVTDQRNFRLFPDA